ncbi:isoprenyl transferase [Pseudemcibacter aquimaris]|uniref:isoprenyl transferase n=1 Tax=Pseudemcibacter aquimaris TaxID=2857064 RepID=UPI00201378A0|nr:isoprenyl transferase [Pseudemcibacter aquimaris]MCC3860885.1 isoprenyl transferase [Pseudemcibacter aquimaris]WDU59703.1 isoprenyl transferase [Pseudemcibacter aquimaris]
MLLVKEEHRHANNAEGDRDPLQHVAIIMDGNGRWAKSRRLPKFAGHKKGADAVRGIVEACCDLDIKYLTLYAFSSENWKRPIEEINDLMGLLKIYLTKEIDDLDAKDIRISFIGSRDRLGKNILSLIDEAEERTKNNKTLRLTLALNYGAQEEIVNATRKIAEQVKQGSLEPDDINSDVFSANLYTADFPEPDLIIRTSGEQRLSNFMLWQAAYAEFVFQDVYWPDYTKATLCDAIDEYYKRDRRYGARP